MAAQFFNQNLKTIMNKRNQTPLIAILLSALLAVASVFTSGCASTGDGEDRHAPLITKQDVITALEITAALAMGDEYELALQYVADARKYIGDGERATVDEVIDHLLSRALHSKLDPAQAIAAKRFIERYRKHFTLESEQIGLDPNILVTINEALDAVETVALEIKRYGAVQPRTYARPVSESIPPMRTRQDLVGHVMGWQEPNPAYLDKWGPGLRTAHAIATQ